MRKTVALTLLTLSFFATSVAARVPAPAVQDRCVELASLLLEGEERIWLEAVEAEGFNQATLRWRSATGSGGSCTVDAADRITGITVEEFAAGPAAGGDGQVGSSEPYRLTCSSDSGRREECWLREGDTARMERQLSRASCVEGQTWAQEGRLLWVDRGCRGQFEITPQPQWEAFALTCSSVDQRRRECRVPERAEVTLLRRQSRADCQEGVSWGYQGSVIWVDRGCRATFQVAPAGWTGGGSGAAVGSLPAASGQEACRRQAELEGLRVLGARNERTDGPVYEVEYWVEDGMGQFRVLCRYDSRTGRAELVNQ